MKRTLVILAVIVLASAAFTSCTVTKGGGCKGTQGFVGYGSHYAGR